MRDIKITILSDGTAQIEEPFCFAESITRRGFASRSTAS